METIIIKLEKLNIDIGIDTKVINIAAGILQKGGLVAFPTETVYGLGANGLSENACKKIYEAKGRPSDNPLILHIGELKQLSTIVREVTPLAQKVIDNFWPGPITLIFKKSDIVPNIVTGSLDTVGVRFPSNKIAQEIIKASNLPIAAPSANSSGKPSPTKASHVEFDLNGKIDMIIDGGNCDFGLESTIIDVTGENAIILRPGAITKKMLENVLGNVLVDPWILEKNSNDFKPMAPGMKYMHYSPNAEVILVKGEEKKVIKNINEFLKENKAKGLKTGVLATEHTKNQYNADVVLSLGNRESLIEVGANLFATLRKFDFLGVNIVYSEVFEEKEEGLAIMNRLNKASGYKCIEV